MEQIRVNMTPIEEAKTIHASQNDNATRKWAFDLYDENGKIDSSGIKEQMIFDSRVGGTEQILPENGSEPTTSPIIADIQYPDALRSEQEFLYRESPTQQDGQAKITRIKGNTVVFNQQVDSTNTYVLNRTTSRTRTITMPVPTIIGHKYLLHINVTNQTTVNGIAARSGGADMLFNTSNHYDIYTCTTVAENIYAYIQSGEAENTTVTISNLMRIDLTQMFGSGSEPTSADQFTSLYPLPYYDYTQGKLLPFKGEELKTTGKNLLPLNLADIKAENTSGTWNDNVYTLNNVSFEVNNDGTIVANGTASGSATLKIPFSCVIGETYILNGLPNGASQGTWMLSVPGIGYAPLTFKATNSSYIINATVYNNATASNVVFKPMVRYEWVIDGTFEAYKGIDILSLPTLTYFPTGMKDCSQLAQVFDEMTESKAIPRVGSVDLGSLEWIYFPSGAKRFVSDGIKNLVKKPPTISSIANIKCAKYISGSAERVYQGLAGIAIQAQTESSAGEIWIYDSAYTDATAFKQMLIDNDVKLYYELATPTEESITTASLVTEKGETPLYYDDELIADCNETISSESGIFDAKIKLMDDETVYSQKIQLHVERKPQ